MTDRTGVDIVRVHIVIPDADPDKVIDRNAWYASCTKCGWKGDLVFKEDAVRRDKVDHIYMKCLATSGSSPELEPA